MWWFLAWSSAFAAPCPASPPTAAAVLARAQSVEGALVEDIGVVHRARSIEAELVRDVECTREPLTPYIAGVILQVRGYTAFFAGERVEADRYFTTARLAQPDLLLSPELAPHPAHPLARAWGEARWDELSAVLPPPPAGVWFVNGRPAPTMPKDLPVVLQIVHPDGTASGSSIVDGPPGPTSPVLSPPPATPEPAPVVAAAAPELAVDPDQRRRRFPAKIVTGLVLGAVGGVLVGQAVARSDEQCTLPDANGDGFLDCPTGLRVGFWSGVGAASAGGGLAIWGFATELGAR